MNRTVWLVMLAVLMAAPQGLLAQEKGSSNKVTLDWAEFVKITGYKPVVAAPGTLTVPWKEVQQLLGVEVKGVNGATVDLPWKEFKALLEWSVKRQAGPKNKVKPPTDYVVATQEYSGKLTNDAAELTLKVKLNILQEDGWKRIGVLPPSVAVRKATLPAGVFLSSRNNTYELLTEKSGEIDVSIDFVVKVDANAGVQQAAFARVLPGAAVLDLTIDRKDADVKVPGSQSLSAQAAANTTRVAAALPSGVPVSISWERAVPKVEAQATRLYAQTRTLVGVADGMLLCREQVDVNVLHTAVRELSMTAPEGVSILSVTGPNVQDWRIKDRKITVVLRREMLGTHQVLIHYEMPAKDAAVVPVVRADGVEREQGFIAVIALANVEITGGETRGATSIDARSLPADIVTMTNQPILLAYRYVGQDLHVPLTVRKHGEVGVLVTIVDSGLLTIMQLPDGRRMTKVTYSVRNNRNQFLRMNAPAGAEIWSVAVAGKAATPARDEQGSVLLPLIRSKASASELTSFPVSIVYVETPAKTAPAAGKLTVSLPTLNVPVMHVMVNYYVPAEGKYTTGGGWSGPVKTGFSGPLHVVTGFSSLSTGASPRVVERKPAQQAAQLQQQFDQRVDQRARAAGATPIRVRLPINGRLFKLEKILALPGDRLFFDLKYRGWKVSQ